MMLTRNSIGMTRQKRPPLSPSSEDKETFCWVNMPRSPTSTLDIVKVTILQKKGHSFQQTEKTLRTANRASSFTPIYKEENCPFDEKEETTSDTESVIGGSRRFDLSSTASLMRNLSNDSGDDEELLGLQFIDDAEGSKGENVYNIGVFNQATLCVTTSTKNH